MSVLEWYVNAAFSSNTESLTCQICNIHVRFRQNQGEASSNLLQPMESPSFKVFRISLCNNHMCLVSDSGEEVATLNIKVSQSLQELSDFTRLRFEAIIPIQESESLGASSSGKGSSQNTRIDINIYGQRETSERVASGLGHAGLFLQDPHWSPAKVPYENPQYLELPDCPSEEDLPFQDLSHTEQENVTVQDLPVDSFKLDLDLLMDSLLSSHDLVQAKADQRVGTPLEEYASSHSS